MARFCPKCGTQALDDKSNFCNKCGTQLPIELINQNNECPHCGTPIIGKESRFCSRCGSELTSIQQVKAKKLCPNCNAPILDETRYYCKSCGAYLHGDQNVIISPTEKTHIERKIAINETRTRSTIPRTTSKNGNSTYQSNWILVLAFLFGLISIFIPPLLVIVVIASAIAVYYDAKALRAGGEAKTETLNSLSWSPLDWGLMVLLLWIIGLPLYLIKRKEIFLSQFSKPATAAYGKVSYAEQPYAKSRPISDVGGQSLTTEFILGLLGGIIGFFAGIAAIGIGGLGSAFGASNADTVIMGGFGAIIFSILGIIGAAIVRKQTKTAGYLMIVAAIGGLICIFVFYILSFILLILAGILAVKHAPEDK
jgi:DNA-directed RNA polymerase subunit RPC12/RpoP